MKNYEELEKIIRDCIDEKDPEKHPYFVIDSLPGMSTYVDSKEKADRVDRMVSHKFATPVPTGKPNVFKIIRKETN